MTASAPPTSRRPVTAAAAHRRPVTAAAAHRRPVTAAAAHRRPVTAAAAHRRARRRADERGEGVISAAIAVLIMAFLGVGMWVAFNTTFQHTAKNVDKQVNSCIGQTSPNC